MTPAIRTIINAALDMKETSIKRAMKGATPKFLPVYELELRELSDARNWLQDQKDTK